MLCDEERIAQVLSILMDNALSYTPAPGSITLSLSFTSGHVSLSVADNGPGIPDSAKKQVFQRFFRQDKAHTSKDHFGLGLSIAREIVRIHRGRLVLSDTPGGGATFTRILRTAPALFCLHPAIIRIIIILSADCAAAMRYSRTPTIIK